MMQGAPPEEGPMEILSIATTGLAAVGTPPVRPPGRGSRGAPAANNARWEVGKATAGTFQEDAGERQCKWQGVSK
jgi:hypothetical protein